MPPTDSLGTVVEGLMVWWGRNEKKYSTLSPTPPTAPRLSASNGMLVLDYQAINGNHYGGPLVVLAASGQIKDQN